MIRSKKGQSTLEYVLLVTAVIGVMIALIMQPNSGFRKSLNSTIVTGTNGMEDMANRLMNSRPRH